MPRHGSPTIAGRVDVKIGKLAGLRIGAKRALTRGQNHWKFAKGRSHRIYLQTPGDALEAMRIRSRSADRELLVFAQSVF
jgi:hypothetical protein